MAFTFNLQAVSMIEEGKYLQITDIANWAEAAYLRNKFGVFLVGEFRTQDTPESIVVATYNPLTAITWVTTTPKNGRHTFKAYAFLLKNTIAPVLGVVNIDATDGKLYQWSGTTWVLVELLNVLNNAYYTSNPLDVPLLSYAYAYRNLLTLEYVRVMKREMDRGADQNKLFYKRTNLDYFISLILGAEYNWALNNYQNYYDITLNLNDIISTGNLS